MIPDKTQELDLRELMARYEHEYGSEAEREFFGQDWSNLVAKCNGPDLGANGDANSDGDSQQVSALTPSVSEWGQTKLRLRDSLRRSGAGVGSRSGQLPKWLSLSLVIVAIVSGLGWLTLGGRGEETTSARAPSSPEPQLHSALPNETAPGSLPGAAALPALDAEPTTSPSKRSSPSASESDAESPLARQAVDAMLAGDRTRALLLYRELSRRAPQSEVFREATRILSRVAAPSSQKQPQRAASPSPGTSAAR
jgi:hypothetical protein